MRWRSLQPLIEEKNELNLQIDGNFCLFILFLFSTSFTFRLQWLAWMSTHRPRARHISPNMNFLDNPGARKHFESTGQSEIFLLHVKLAYGCGRFGAFYNFVINTTGLMNLTFRCQIICNGWVLFPFFFVEQNVARFIVHGPWLLCGRWSRAGACRGLNKFIFTAHTAYHTQCNF